ncbi:DUF6192 family protein [Streptomyces phaeochromogenes]|uniref:DUF6192 family protein n=1 Tax=Streptomyces phaeochromogenes TaxID=1923 RepID=UPI0033CFB11C
MAADLLHGLDAAFIAMSDDTVRAQVNHAQVERSRPAHEEWERRDDYASTLHRDCGVSGMLLGSLNFVLGE